MFTVRRVSISGFYYVQLSDFVLCTYSADVSLCTSMLAWRTRIQSARDIVSTELTFEVCLNRLFRVYLSLENATFVRCNVVTFDFDTRGGAEARTDKVCDPVST